MASTPICTPCLHAIRLNTRHQIQWLARSRRHETLPSSSAILSSQSLSMPKPQQFTTTARQRASELPSNASASSTPSRQPPPAADSFKTLASTLRTNKALRSTTEPYIAYGSTEDLYLLCASAPAYTMPSPSSPATSDQLPSKPQNSAGEDIGIPTHADTFWYRPHTTGGLGLDVTFNTWAQVVYLHMYLLTARLRMFPAQHARIWHQQLLDHFFYAAEDRMERLHGITARSARNKYLKDLWQQWRGVIFSYDEGLVKGDAVLAGAVWRNLFKGDLEADVEGIARVVVWLRRELKMLEGVSDEAIAEARVRFSDPGALEISKVLERRSAWMTKSFSEGEAKVEGAQQTSSAAP